jgi:hypothetical protein
MKCQIEGWPKAMDFGFDADIQTRASSATSAIVRSLQCQTILEVLPAEETE